MSQTNSSTGLFRVSFVYMHTFNCLLIVLSAKLTEKHLSQQVKQWALHGLVSPKLQSVLLQDYYDRNIFLDLQWTLLLQLTSAFSREMFC